MATATEARQIETSCQEIMNCITESSLNYSVKLTPYSLYITIRKSFSKTPVPVPSYLFQSHSKKALLKQQVQTLEAKLKQLEVYKDTLECRIEEELNYKEKIKDEMKLLREMIKRSLISRRELVIRLSSKARRKT